MADNFSTPKQRHGEKLSTLITSLTSYIIKYFQMKLEVSRLYLRSIYAIHINNLLVQCKVKQVCVYSARCISTT